MNRFHWAFTRCDRSRRVNAAVTCTLKPRGSVDDAHARGRTLLGSRRQTAVVTRPAGPAVRTVGAQRAVLLPTVHHFQHQPAETRSVLHYSRVRMKPYDMTAT